MLDGYMKGNKQMRKVKMGRPSKKRPYIEPFRKKCTGCGGIRWVKYTHYVMPSVDEFDVPVYVKNEFHPERKTIKGANVQYYCGYDCYQTDGKGENSK